MQYRQQAAGAVSSAGHRRSVVEGPQAQAHGRAAGGPRVRGDLAVLGLGQAPDDEKPDADAAEPAAVTGLALEEPVEDALVIAVGDADALVFHGHLEVAFHQPGPDGDGAA